MLGDIQQRCWEIAESKGWHGEEDTVPAKLLMIHSEVSEATEDYRNGVDLVDVYFEGVKPCGFGIELADIIIRVFDLATAVDIDLDKMLVLKMRYNETRPERHGGKKI